MKNVMLYPCVYGVMGYNKTKVATCIIKKNGKMVLSCNKNIYKINNNYLLRGLFYLFFGIYQTIFGLFKFNEHYNEMDFLKKAKNSLNVSAKTVILFLIIIISFIFSWIVLGILPLKLSFYILPKNCDLFLKRLSVGIVKSILLYLELFILKFFNVFKQYYKFNVAIKEHQDLNQQTNFLLYFISSSFLCLIIISVFGMVVNVWHAPIINILVTLFIFALNYEIINALQKTKYGRYLTIPFYFLIKEKPSQNEVKCVKMILKEFEQGNTIMTNEKIDQTKIAFSEAYVNAKEKLEIANKFEKSDLDFIFCEVLNKSRAEIKLLTEISKTEYKQIMKAVERRIKGEPITKIFGHTNFYGLDFKVTKDVLSPRMETELLVEQVIKECSPKTKVLDVGTGSGAIAITIAKNTKSKVTAVDVSEEALKVAKQNAKENGVIVSFKKSNLFSAISKFSKFDIIVSNPPYIPTKDIDTLDEEVKKYDPILALDGGITGLEFYEQIIEEAPKRLTKNGKIFFEVGINQAKDVKKLLQKNFKDIRIVKDYNKIERVVIATLNC